MIRRFKLGRDVELHKRTLECGLLSLIGPRRAPRRRRRATCRTTEHAHRAGRLGGAAVRLIATDLGVDVLCEAADTEARRRRADRRGRRARRRGRRRGAARRDRPPALRRRPRRHRDPAGGRAQRARGLVREGLLRRPGDRRAAATSAASRTATCAGCGSAGRPRPATPLRLGEREVGRLGSVVESPAHGPIALALVRREAEPGRRARRRRRRRARRRSSTSRSRRRKLSSETSTGGRAHMAAHVLVVATVTAASDDLLAALRSARDGLACRSTSLLVMPASGPDDGRDGAAPATRRSSAGATAGPEGRGRDRRRRPGPGGRRGVRAGPLRRGDRLDAAGPDVALAALGRPVPDRRAHRPAGHARRRAEHGAARCTAARRSPRRERGAARACST